MRVHAVCRHCQCPRLRSLTGLRWGEGLSWLWHVILGSVVRPKTKHISFRAWLETFTLSPKLQFVPCNRIPNIGWCTVGQSCCVENYCTVAQQFKGFPRLRQIHVCQFPAFGFLGVYAFTVIPPGKQISRLLDKGEYSNSFISSQIIFPKHCFRRGSLCGLKHKVGFLRTIHAPRSTPGRGDSWDLTDWISIKCGLNLNSDFSVFRCQRALRLSRDSARDHTRVKTLRTLGTLSRDSI